MRDNPRVGAAKRDAFVENNGQQGPGNGRVALGPEALPWLRRHGRVAVQEDDASAVHDERSERGRSADGEQREKRTGPASSTSSSSARAGCFPARHHAPNHDRPP